MVTTQDSTQIQAQQQIEPTEPIKLLRTSESEKLERIRHTFSHVMAMAVQRLFPKAQVTIGPSIDYGFYYDFDAPEPFTDKDLKRIKKEMIKIINKNVFSQLRIIFIFFFKF